MADTGWKNPTNTASSTDINNPNRLHTSDNSRAWFNWPIGGSEQATYNTFSMGVPVGATIDGIEVQVEGRYYSGSGETITCQLVRGGTASGNTKVTASFPLNDTYRVVGGATDLWGLTLSASDVNASNFGVRLDEPIDETEFDNVQIKVYYTSTGSASLSPSISPSVSPSVSPSQSPSASLSPSISPSISPSQSPSASFSPSISPSISPSQSPSASLSPSISPSQSPSASFSPSVSPSFSPSISPSVSPSISPSISPSPSVGWTDYTREANATLPTNDNDLTTAFTSGDITDVSTDNGVRVSQTATDEYSIFQFKDFVGSSSTATLTWDGQSDIAPTSSTVVLQIYNRNTPAWENVDTDSTSAANTDFILTGNIPDLTNYKDASNTISCRVYQLAQ